MAKFKCFVCGYIFDEEQAGIQFSEITECPICAESRDIFRRLEDEPAPAKEENQPAEKTEDEPKKDESAPETKAEEATGEEKKDDENASKEEAKAESGEATEAAPKEETKEESKEESKEEPKDNGFVIEKRQEFWLNEKDKEPEKPVDKSNISTYYGGGIPVKSPEELEREAKKKEEENRPKLDPIEGNGSVCTVIDGGDRSSDGSDSEVVVVEENEATSDVDAGDDDFVFEEAVIEEADAPLQTEEVPSAVSAGIRDEGDFFTGFDSSPDFGDTVRTEEFIFDDEEPVGEAVEITEEAEVVSEEILAEETPAEETPVEETPAEEAVEEAHAEEVVIEEEVVEEAPAEEAVIEEEVAEEAPVEEVAVEEETVTEEAPAEEVVIEEEVVEEAPEEEVLLAEEPVAEEEPVIEEEPVTEEETLFEEEPVVEEETLFEEETAAEEEVVDDDDDDLLLDTSIENALIEELLLGRIFGDFEDDDTDEDFDELRAFLSSGKDEDECEAEETVFEEEESEAEDAAEEPHVIGTAVVKGGNGDLITEDMAKQSSFEQYAHVQVQNGLEEIILLPAQLDPMPFTLEEEILTQTVLGRFSEVPVTMPQPFGSSSALSWGEYIPFVTENPDYSGADLILIKGQHSHIPGVSGKEELRREVAKAKEISGGKPVGISLMIGRIEQDLAACVYSDVDFVVLNDTSAGMLPYALRRAMKYLSRVNSGLDLLIGIEDVNDAREIAKLMAMGADYILLNREYDSARSNYMTKELKEIARNTGHGSVQEFNMYDICTISADLAANTDISHF